MTTMVDQQGVRVLLRVMLLIGDQRYPLGDTEIVCETSDLYEHFSDLGTHLTQARADTTRWTAGPPTPTPLPSNLREHIAALCQRLGVAEPVYDQISEQEAVRLLTRLQAEEDELLHTAEEAQAPHLSSAAVVPMIEKALIRQLKERWRARFRPGGEVDTVVALWEAFKTRVCGEAVSDRAMRPGQYEQLLAALVHPGTERKG